MGKYDELVERLRRDSQDRSGSSIMNGCVDCGLSANDCDDAATAITTLEAELAAARNRHQATVVAAATHLMRAMNAEAELAEAKAEIERLADNGCHLEMLLAAMKARGDRLAEFAVHKRECLIVKVWWQAGNCQCGLTQALTGWRDQHHGGNDADT